MADDAIMTEDIYSGWPVFYRYWGKAKRGEGQPGDEYHLLVYHCLDVAACGYWMVKRNQFGAGALFAQLGFTEDEGAVFFAWLLAWHDAGKFARGFQQLREYPYLVPPVTGMYYSADYRHDSLGYWPWHKCWRKAARAKVKGDKKEETKKEETKKEETKKEGWIPFGELENNEIKALDILLNITMGHHGKPPALPAPLDGVMDLNFTQEDIQAAQQWLSALADLLGLERLPAQCRDGQWLKKQLMPASWLLAGLVTLADWLGSNQQWFPYKAAPLPLAEYWQITLRQAARAMDELPSAAIASEFAGIRHLFPFIAQPTPLQQLAAELPLTDGEAELFIFEDVTGAGKTEAALILVNRLLAEKKAQGFYIGLPTMATANAMFDRLQSSYRAMFTDEHDPSLALAHSASKLKANFQDTLWTYSASGDPEYGAGESTAESACHLWFADSRKKALLAEVGVGTIDQVLMAVMAFRHQSLRMLGLQGKVLLLDEVHAYDAYVNELLESLLEFHARQGGSVIILSATLSQKQRAALVAAFARGRGLPKSAANPVLNPQPDYPWVTQYCAGVLAEYPLASRAEVSRKVAVDWRYDEQSCLAYVRRAVREGRCISWIRNTVDDAIRMYQQLSAELDADQLLLFHSRFAFIDRLEIEKRVTQWCGKPSTAQSRRGKVVIATQVIEQSMDLDFDMMLTDLAPVDLLVQRAGRLQRHVRDNDGNCLHQPGASDERPPPQLVILAPAWQEHPDSSWLQKALPGTAAVYQDHGRLWLGQRLLRQLGEIHMPDDARVLVEGVYGEDVAIPDGLIAHTNEQEGRSYSARAYAGYSVLTIGEGYTRGISPWEDDIELSTRGEDDPGLSASEDDGKLSTRLSDATIQLYLTRRQHGQIIPYASDSGSFCWEMSRLQISEKRWNKIKDKVPHLSGNEQKREELKQLRKKYRLPPCEIIELPDGDNDFYSATMGLHA